MKILTDIRFYFVIVTISLLSLTVHYMNLKDELAKCKTDKGFVPGGDIQKAELTKQVDSLQSELFVKGVELGRYEIALEMFKEKNKTAGEQFELILTTQTE